MQEVAVSLSDPTRMSAAVRAPILCLLFLFVNQLPAQTMTDVQGVVEDPSGAVIVGAQVALHDASGHIVGQALSDNSGRFRFPGIRRDNHVVSVRKEGFTDKESRLTAGGSPQLLHITMALAAVRTQVELGGEAARVSTDLAANQNAQR